MIKSKEEEYDDVDAHNYRKTSEMQFQSALRLLKVKSRAFSLIAMRSTSNQVCMQLLPGPRSFFDEAVQVKVEGLAPQQQVELRSRLTDHKGVVFKASSVYIADATGQVDVCTSPSLSGTYTGVEPMGLFWSMVPETPHRKMFIKTASSPILVNIDALSNTGEVLASETSERQFMIEGMRRIPLKEDKVRGVLFLPPGKAVYK